MKIIILSVIIVFAIFFANNKGYATDRELEVLLHGYSLKDITDQVAAQLGRNLDDIYEILQSRSGVCRVNFRNGEILLTSELKFPETENEVVYRAAREPNLSLENLDELESGGLFSREEFIAKKIQEIRPMLKVGHVYGERMYGPIPKDYLNGLEYIKKYNKNGELDEFIEEVRANWEKNQEYEKLIKLDQIVFDNYDTASKFEILNIQKKIDSNDFIGAKYIMRTSGLSDSEKTELGEVLINKAIVDKKYLSAVDTYLYELRDPRAAENLSNELLHMATNENDYYGMAQANIALARFDIENDNSVEAERKKRLAIEYYKKANNFKEAGDILGGLGDKNGAKELYYKDVEYNIEQKNYEKARSVCLYPLQDYTRHNQVEEKIALSALDFPSKYDSFDGIGSIIKKQIDAGTAITWLEERATHYDSIGNHEKYYYFMERADSLRQ